MKIFQQFARNWHYFEGYKGLFIFHYVLKFIAMILSLVSPLLLANVITNILNSELK